MPVPTFVSVRRRFPPRRVVADGKFLRSATDDTRFLVKGVTYGTFAPDSQGYQFPSLKQIAEDFRLMAGFGINTVRTYTPPRLDLLDEAARNGLRVMVGLPWSQHVAFLDDRRLARSIRQEIVRQVAALSQHPAVLTFALGNEIPAGVVRWHGRVRIENFLRDLYDAAKASSPASLFTYVNFPPTEFLDLSFFDICAFNVYLHREPELRAYIARLQHVAGHKPLLLAEAGADSIREGGAGQADITAMHIRAAFEEGACGAIAFAWTDEWWRGGHQVEDWAFGLVDRDRHPKPAAVAVSAAFDDAPFSSAARASWPRVSVVVCAFNAASTLEDCITSLERLTYPDYELIVVNDGSNDRTSEIAHGHPRVRVIDTPNRGLSAARNVGLAEATGEIVAYTDADVRVDRDWLTFLVQPFLASDVVGSGGPNVVPDDDPPMAQCIARAPGEPTHVLLDDRIAEHVPGCNMAFRREALLAIGGFNPIYLRAGDDVDVCWRLQARGWRIGFSGAALVWHHHRSSINAYWRQQVGYGEGETWLMAHHPEKFLDGHMLWRGRIYSPLPFIRSLNGTKINAGVWGTAPFPSVYRTDVHPFAFLPHSIRWQVWSFVMILAGLGVSVLGNRPRVAALLLATGAIGLAVTIAKNLTYAVRSQVDSLPGSKLWYRAAVAYLHFIQPLARARGRIRGVLSPPEIALPQTVAQKSRGPRPSLREGWRAILLLSGTVTEDRFWSETWTSSERVLSQLADWLRRSRAVRAIEIDEGWSDDRDLGIPVGRWAWLDTRALVEDHGGGKSMLRVSTHLRPTMLGVVTALALGVALLVAAVFGVALRWPPAGAITGGFTILRYRHGVVGHGAGDRRPRPEPQAGDDRPGDAADAVRTDSGAAPRAVAAADVRAAQRHDLRRDDPVARGGHVHAARGGHWSSHRRAKGVRRRLRSGHRGLARHARAASRSRRTATCTSRIPTTTSSAASTRRTRRLSPWPAITIRGTDFRATTGSPPRRSSIRRTASRSPRTGISSSRIRTTTASAASIGPPASSPRSRAPARTASTETTRPRFRRRSTRQAPSRPRRTATSISPTR